jgi:SdrD B-like domain
VNPFTGAANLRDNSYGPGGFEYYWGDDGFEGEAVQGSLLQIPGSPQVFVTQSNALGHNAQVGLLKLDNTTGTVTAAGNVFYGDFQTGNNLGKSNGLGALIALCDAPPIQIGNRVWFDQNRNGIQDAGEPAVPGATVALFDKTKANRLAVSVTNAGGEFYFASVSATVGTTTAALTPNTDFVLVITDLGSSSVVTANGLSLTGVSPVSPGDRSINNDAVLTAGLPSISLTTGLPGSVNHSYDFGLTGNVCSLVFSVSATACNPATNSYDLRGLINVGNSVGADTARVQVVVGSETRVVRVPLVNGSGAYSFSVITNPTPLVGTVSVRAEGQACPAVVLPFTPPASCTVIAAQASEVGSFVWLDQNRNGQRDPGEPGVGGVKVMLWRVNAADLPAIKIDSAITDNGGNYRIKNVTQGRYLVRFDPTTFPADVSGLTPAEAPNADPMLASRPDPGTYQTPVFTLSPDSGILRQNAGLLPVCRPVCVPISIRRIR